MTTGLAKGLIGAVIFHCIHQGKERTIEVPRRKVIVGRPSSTVGNPDLDMRPDKNVSRRHACIWQESGFYWLEDLCSRLGVKVNGLPIKTKHKLSFGDKILIGRTIVQLVPSATEELVQQK